MAERQITREDIESALSHETRRTPGQPGTIWVWGTSLTGRILKVCLSAYDEKRVITVAWPDE
jgi:hypothetical protein